MEREDFSEIYRLLIHPVISDSRFQRNGFGQILSAEKQLYTEYTSISSSFKNLHMRTFDGEETIIFNRHKKAACICLALVRRHLLAADEFLHFYPFNDSGRKPKYGYMLNESIAFQIGAKVVLFWLAAEYFKLTKDVVNTEKILYSDNVFPSVPKVGKNHHTFYELMANSLHFYYRHSTADTHATMAFLLNLSAIYDYFEAFMIEVLALPSFKTGC